MGTLNYVALVWENSEANRRTADHLERLLLSLSLNYFEAFSDKGLRVYCERRTLAGAAVLPLPDRGGVIIGHLFHRRQSNHPRATISSSEKSLLIRTQGRHLLENYWGGYVGILLDQASQAIHVLRDPTGQVPCLTVEHHGVTLYFSSAEDVAQLGVIDAHFNWKHIAAQLAIGTIENRETGLSSVARVLGGECITHHGGKRERSIYWDPGMLAQKDVIEDATVAAELVRETVLNCISAWASPYDALVLRLSGGLDSSIVLHCLSNAVNDPRIFGLTYYSDGCNSDERPFARIAAGSARCSLFEQRRETVGSIETILEVPRLAEFRFFAPLDLERTEFERELAQRLGVHALFDGHGGDGIFYQNPLELASADYLSAHGIDRKFFNIALHIARTRDLSVWRVMRKSMAAARSKSTNPFAEAFRHLQLVSREVMTEIAASRSFVHPWLAATEAIPPGKLAHITYMSIPPNLDVPFSTSTAPDQITPLVSQPLYELVLRIPTYVLTLGGIDRAIARRAFSGRVPKEILDRQSKGGVEEHAKALIARNRAFIRSLLLEGYLVREGLLDRARVADAVSGKPSACPVTPVEMLTIVSAEAWLQTWNTRSQDQRLRA